MGHAMMYMSTMKIFTIHTVFAPMYRPCLLQAACGTISPHTTMDSVDTARPTRPSVRSAIRIAMSAFTIVFPSSNVHSSKLPLARTGMIFLAYSFSSSSPPSARISSETMSRDIRPRVRPENNPESSSRKTASITLTVVFPNTLEDSWVTAQPSLQRGAVTGERQRGGLGQSRATFRGDP